MITPPHPPLILSGGAEFFARKENLDGVTPPLC